MYYFSIRKLEFQNKNMIQFDKYDKKYDNNFQKFQNMIKLKYDKILWSREI